MKRIVKLMIPVLFGLSWLYELAAQVVVDSVNADKQPPAGPLPSWLFQAGWFYTPSFDYSLNGIFTKFGGTVDSRTVALEVFDGHPNAGSPQLAASSFTPLANAFSGGYFEPINFIGGHQYFIGFRNIEGLTANLSFDSDSTYLDFYYGLGVEQYPIHGSVTAPILQFTTVPEPSTLSLVGFAILGFLVLGAPCALTSKRKFMNNTPPNKCAGI